MGSNAKNVEKSFFSVLLELCKSYGVSIHCSDPYEYLELGEYSEEFAKNFKRLYIDELHN